MSSFAKFDNTEFKPFKNTCKDTYTLYTVEGCTNRQKREKIIKTIDVACGIYDTKYTLTAHRDGSITVKSPYIKWINNKTGTLQFKRTHFAAGKLTDTIKRAFADRDSFLPGYVCATLQDAIDGYLN